MAINWNDYYAQAQAEFAPTYNERLEKNAQAKNAEISALDTQKQSNQKQFDQNLQNALQGAYVTRRMAEQTMPQTLAAQGARGGMTETTSNQLWNNYLKSRNASQGSYNQSLSELLNTYNTNLAGINSRYAQTEANMLRERDQDINERANTLYNAAWQAWQAEEQKRQFEEQLALQKAENERAQREFEWNMQQAQAQAAAQAASRGSGGSSGGSSSGGASSGSTRSNWSGAGYYYTGSGWQKINSEAQYNKSVASLGKQLVKMPGVTTAGQASKAVWRR